MKTQSQIQNSTRIAYLLLVLFALAFTPIQAQTGSVNFTDSAQNERTIKGIISDAGGPLEGVNIILKSTKIGTTTNSKGEFTFPKPLKTGDVLLLSYLGYETQEATIRADVNFLRLTLTEDLIEFSGALNSDKPYKTKRDK